MSKPRTDAPLLEVEDLQTHYPVTEGWLRREVGRVRAVDGVSFSIDRGQAFGLVGESGSGKTTLAHSILRLEEPTAGEIRFDGESVRDRSGAALKAYRRRVQLIVQDPTDAFSPRMRVGEAVAEPLVLHGMDDADRRRAIVEDLLERVGLAAEDADSYPHEFSTGEQQRIAIARALVLNPDLIVADEPTSALDGRTREEILALLDEVCRVYDVSLLFVSHDVEVVRRFCDEVAVMYLGEFVEQGSIDEVFSSPAHPYTRVLLDSVPSLTPGEWSRTPPLTETMPEPADPPSGCRFHTRCPEVIPPDDVDLSDVTWRSLAAFRFTVQTGELPDEVTVEEDESVDAATVRDCFDLPDPIQDPDVEEGLTAAIESLCQGNRADAAEELARTLPSVCERAEPSVVDVDGRPVRCHRYDAEREGEPRSW